MIYCFILYTVIRFMFNVLCRVLFSPVCILQLQPPWRNKVSIIIIIFYRNSTSPVRIRPYRLKLCFNSTSGMSKRGA